MILEFCKWLASTKWSIALHESLYMYPWIESTHVLSICLFIGILLFIDLRLLGKGFTSIPISRLNSSLLPWSIFGFVLMTITGLLLFYAVPVRNYHNIFFRFKLLLILLAGINMLLFHKKMKKEGHLWDVSNSIPLLVKRSAFASLFLWALVIISGRMIAYNWFDCDIQPQPDWVNFLASCEPTVYELESL